MLITIAVLTLALPQAGPAPEVTALEPANQSVEVDAGKTTRLVATFDRAMSNGGWSFCGGGPAFPKMKGRPRWVSPARVEVEVELEPDHEYRLSLNCGSAKNFRSAGGAPLVPVAWSFTTLPAKLPDAAKQKAENRKALAVLQKVLAGSYSYYDLRVRDWARLVKQHEAAIVGAKTTRGWASAVARMLAATEDIHLSLRLGESFFATGTRAIDPLFRDRLLQKYLTTKGAGDHGILGRTDDGIGYLMIGAWSNASAVAAIETALEGLRDCKGLVVDVRPNSGGDERLAQQVAAWFVEGTKVYAKNRYRTRPGKDGFGPILERSVSGNQVAARRYVGPVVVLTSRYVMSSNEAFVLMMKQAADCTVVGQRTFGSSGNPKPHELGNGVTVVVPSWQCLRLDGTCFEGEGLAPDVEVAVDVAELEQRDPILERALEILRERLK